MYCLIQKHNDKIFISDTKQTIKMDKQWKADGTVEFGLVFQFIVMKDGKSFRIHTFGLRFKRKDGTDKVMGADELGLTEADILMSLQKIYNNHPVS